jgi:hypothetical protein
MNATERIRQVLVEVGNERLRQDRKWGVQSYNAMVWLGILAEEFGESAKAAVEVFFGPLNDMGKAKYLTELKQLRLELIQTAAVAVAAVESLDRNELRREKNAEYTKRPAKIIQMPDK